MPLSDQWSRLLSGCRDYSAREAIVACHAELQKDHRRMGYGTYAAGPIGKPDDWLDPKDVKDIKTSGHLRSVA